jgi:hypothetical protein
MIEGIDRIHLGDGVIDLLPTQQDVDASPVEFIVRANGEGGTYSDLTVLMIVQDVNDVPSEPSLQPLQGEYLVGMNITMISTGSTDIDGDDLEYMWDLGDGTTTGWGADLIITHEYSHEGNFTITQFVRDGRGGENSTSVRLRILPDPDSRNGETGEEDNEKDEGIDPILVFLAVFSLLVLLAVMIAYLIARENRRGYHFEGQDIMEPLSGFRSNSMITARIDEYLEE